MGDMDVFLEFEGVESAYYVYLNDQLIGYAEDSLLPSRFKINGKYKKGKNLLTVKAYRYSDGSYLEGQDYWKYSGIERSVSLTARPASRVEDFEISAPLVNSYRDGDFSLRLKMDSPTKGERVDVALSLGGNPIWSDSHAMASSTDSILTFRHMVEDASPGARRLPTRIF